MPTRRAVITTSVHEREEGEIQGIDTSGGALRSTIAPIIGGAMYQSFGIDALFGFVMVALATGLVFVSVLRHLVPVSGGLDRRDTRKGLITALVNTMVGSTGLGGSVMAAAKWSVTILTRGSNNTQQC